ncbi:hypothetical protein [Puerhibacterium puerhi]|uniref:hypothetical protein n=1 Tax=Puerhibacterium puerhi TaxID=2692623 RepID=UPI001F2B6EB6|nr:hypothetical protein [Puerhibacterium puerhi]
MTGEGRRADREAPPARPRPAEEFWPAPVPLNYARPDHVPARPQGSVPVICRLVWSTHEELVPARAIRWTVDRVMVAVTAPEARSQDHELLVWLRPQDVYRTIPPRRRPTPPVTVG